MKAFTFIVLAAFSLALAGCADMPIPKADNILTGSTSIKIGMTKNQVASVYGEPDSKQMVVAKEWGEYREEWFYKARYSGLPVGTDYLVENVFLYFDGENLTNISQKPLGKSEEVAKADAQ